MSKSSSLFIAVCSAMAIACVTAFYAEPAAAQTATKLKCNGCVKSKQLKNNTIKSADIKDGQVTNPDLGTNAVDGSKIADGAVSLEKLSPGVQSQLSAAGAGDITGVTAGTGLNGGGDTGDVTLNVIFGRSGFATTSARSDHSHSGADINDGTITADDLASGSVGSDEIATDAVTGAEVQDGSLAGADLADGAVGAAKLGLANTIFLEDTGSNTDNCTDLRAALFGLIGPAAVVLGPGIYDCGLNAVVLRSAVGLIGSGRNLTTIIGGNTGQGVVQMQGDDITLRDLTVMNDGAGTINGVAAVIVGANFTDTRNWRISGVTAEATNTQALVTGIRAGQVDCDGGVMTDVSATAGGSVDFNTAVSIGCTAGSLTASNLTAEATGGGESKGLENDVSSSLTLRNSSVTGGTWGIAAFGVPVKVISSELNGPLIGNDSIKCVGAYDAAGDPLNDGTFAIGSVGCLP